MITLIGLETLSALHATYSRLRFECKRVCIHWTHPGTPFCIGIMWFHIRARLVGTARTSGA